jgi:hypothetical protein
MPDAVAAAAAAAPVQPSAPIEAVATPPAPLSEQVQPLKEAPIEQPAKIPSTREALRAAREKVEANEAAKAAPAAGDVKDPAKGAALERDPASGKFAPKDPAAAAADKGQAPLKPGAQEKPAAAELPAPAAKRTVAAPDRFSNDAKAVWDTAPEPVKAEVDRMHREMTAGIEKHRAGAEAYEKVRRFHDMAERGGTTLEIALDRYTKMEGLLRQAPLRGLEEVCNNIGVSLRQVAEMVLGRTPDQERAQSDNTIRELRQTVAQLQQAVGGVAQNMQQQHRTSLEQQITDWAADKPHFELIAPHIAVELQAGAANLDAAYEAVLQKHPALAALAKPAKPAEDVKPAASSAAAPDLTAQTDKGSKSIKGAPGPGSEPAARPRSNSIREALRRAAARAG